MTADEALKKDEHDYSIIMQRDLEIATSLKNILHNCKWSDIEAIVNENWKFGNSAPRGKKKIAAKDLAAKTKWIYDFYKKLMLFPDEKTLSQFKKMGCNSDLLGLFKSYEDINKEFRLCAEKGIIVISSIAIELIKSYLQTKFANKLLMKSYSVKSDGINKTKLTRDLELLKRNRSYSGENPRRPSNLYEILLNGLITTSGPFSGTPENPKIDINLGIEISRGNTESIILTKMVEDCFHYNKRTMNRTQFYCAIYPLMRLIMTKGLPSEDEFLIKQYKSYKSWESFQAKKLHTILYPQRKKKKISSIFGSLLF